MTWMWLPMSSALARPVVELSSVAADPCGFVRGTVETRESAFARTVSLSLNRDPWRVVRVAAGEREAPFEVYVGRAVELRARWWFLESDPVTVRMPLEPAMSVSGPQEAPEREVGDLEIALDPRCNPRRLQLTVTEGARVLSAAPPAGPFTQVPLPLDAGHHTITAALTTADGLRVATADWSVRVTPPCEDVDQDGYLSCRGIDCDDRDRAVHPGALEIDRNGKDDDCDGLDGRDADRDGFVAAESGGTDCNDAMAAVHPGALSLPDADGDGVPWIERVDFDCDGDSDLFDGTLDCDDHDPAIPRPEEPRPTGADEDCDGKIDEGTVAYDDDGDGMTELAGDCDDGDESVFLGARERPDCRDNDCDGEIDEGITRRRVDDAYERVDTATVSGEVRIVSRDANDTEHLRVWAHDGLFDSFYVSVRAVRLGDGLQYWLRVTDPRGGVHEELVDAAGGAVWYGGKSGRDDTGTYEVEIVPATWVEGLEYCPLELYVSSG